MSMIRTEKQTALQDLLVALQETADMFRDTADYVDEQSLSRELESIAGEREGFLPSLRKLLRDNEDLPSEPDRERETAKKLLSRLFAAVDSNSTGEILMEREKEEDHVKQALTQCRKIGLEEECGDFLQDIDKHMIGTHEKLQKLLAQYHD